MNMFESIVFIAFAWGAFSALSLPLGASLGLIWQPSQKVNSSFMAFGAGALLFALSIELFGHIPHHVEKHGNMSVISALGGAIIGGLLFDFLNNLVNDHGAFVRKVSSAKRYIAKLKLNRARKMIDGLSQISALSVLPPDKVAKLIHAVEEVLVPGGQPVFRQGAEAHDMYFTISGNIEIVLHEATGVDKKVATLRAGDTFGEMGILLDVPRTADAIATTNARLYKLSRHDFDQISQNIPELKEELSKLAHARLNELSVRAPHESGDEWKERTLSYLQQNHLAVTGDDIEKEGHHTPHDTSAAIAIWMGILIDGIPESLIIGILAVSPDGMSSAFVAGVFLANLPEAMSSAVIMRKGGMTRKRVLTMWGSLCLMTGIGAAIGAFAFPAHPEGNVFYLVLGIEGLAAGAMLTMIAETMLPEAFEQGGTVVGIATLLGFLSALLVKIYG